MVYQHYCMALYHSKLRYHVLIFFLIFIEGTFHVGQGLSDFNSLTPYIY